MLNSPYIIFTNWPKTIFSYPKTTTKTSLTNRFAEKSCWLTTILVNQFRMLFTHSRIILILSSKREPIRIRNRSAPLWTTWVEACVEVCRSRCMQLTCIRNMNNVSIARITCLCSNANEVRGMRSSATGDGDGGGDGPPLYIMYGTRRKASARMRKRVQACVRFHKVVKRNPSLCCHECEWSRCEWITINIRFKYSRRCAKSVLMCVRVCDADV